jgi:hypothetical protein
VLLVLARRLLAGQQTYGRLALTHDARNRRRKMAEEVNSGARACFNTPDPMVQPQNE